MAVWNAQALSSAGLLSPVSLVQENEAKGKLVSLPVSLFLLENLPVPTGLMQLL